MPRRRRDIILLLAVLSAAFGAACLEPEPQRAVRADGEEMTPADDYHERTKHTRAGVMARAGGPDWATQPSVFKAYPDAPRVALPRARVENAISTGDAVDRRRGGLDATRSGSMTLLELSTLLHLTNGITAVKEYPGLTYYLRAAPSAGALYPTVTYVLVNDVEGLEPGLYHYGVAEHELRRLHGGREPMATLAAASSSGHRLRAANVVLAFTSVYFRSSWKYGERAYRYCLLDAGHVAVNAMLAAAALGYDTRPVGRFDDRKVNGVIGLDDGEEGALLLVPVGRPARAVAPAEPVFAPQPRQSAAGEAAALPLLHGRTYLHRTEDPPAVPPPPRPWADKAYADRPVIALPTAPPKGDALLPTIEKRRSARDWLAVGMTLEQLSSALYYAFGLRDGVPDPSVESSRLVRLYLIVNAVQGLEPGVYSYRRRDHALSVIRTGYYRRRSYEISLFQEVVGHAAVALVMTIDRSALAEADGDRGYRYAAMDAGMIGGIVYLQTVALGLGCTGIGAFFDDEVSAVIEVAPAEEMVIYMCAIGVTPPG